VVYATTFRIELLLFVKLYSRSSDKGAAPVSQIHFIFMVLLPSKVGFTIEKLHSRYYRYFTPSSKNEKGLIIHLNFLVKTLVQHSLKPNTRFLLHHNLLLPQHIFLRNWYNSSLKPNIHPDIFTSIHAYNVLTM
jgi:hypothetical protein